MFTVDFNGVNRKVETLHNGKDKKIYWSRKFLSKMEGHYIDQILVKVNDGPHFVTGVADFINDDWRMDGLNMSDDTCYRFTQNEIADIQKNSTRLYK